MSKKILKRSLALGALMAFVITGSAMAANSKIEVDGGDMSVTNVNVVTADDDTRGIYATNGAKVTLEGDSTINVTHKGETRKVYGIYAYSNNSAINVNGNSLQVNVVNEYNGPNENDGGWARGISANSGAIINLNVKEVGVCVCASVDDLLTSAQNTGLSALYNGSRINVNSNSLDVTAYGKSAFGLYAGNYSKPANDTVLDDNASIVVSEGTVTNINVYNDKNDKKLTGTGIAALSMGRIDIKGDLYVNAKNAVATRGDAIVNINTDGGNKVVQLTGDINFNYDGETSGTPVNANVNINLTNDKSFFNGKICVTGENYPEGYDEVKSMSIKVTNGAQWNLTGASIVNNAEFGKDSVLSVEGNTYLNNDGTNTVYALNASGAGSNSLKVEKDAKIVIADVAANNTYNIAQGFAGNADKTNVDEEGNAGYWTLEAENKLLQAEWNLKDKNLQATITAKAGEELVSSGVATNENQVILSAIAEAKTEENSTVNAINELASSDNVTTEDIQKGAAALLQVAEAGGFTGNVVSVSKQVNGSVGARNSFAGPKHGGSRHRGGHGPSVTEEANGSAIWAQYVHGKDKVDGIDMGGVENAYESQFNGVVLGADFKQVGSYASGIAFNYGEGDSHSKKNVVQSDSEFDFWGVSYYGAVKKQDTNFIFDIGYSESDSDVEQKFGGNTITANPEASTWTAGVKVEKLIDKGAVQIVPYAGLRFMTIDTDDYEAKGGTASEATYYSTERQDIWLLPVGVSLSQENVYDSGWIVTPKADFSYTWAMGDTDSSMTVNIPNVGSDTLGYTVMDDGSFMATVGLDAQKEDWTFGVAYSYQKGDSTRSDRWYVNARYSF